MIFREMNESGGSVILIKSPDLMTFKSPDDLIKEWIFWLSYVDFNTKKEMDIRTNKKAKDLTLLKALKKYPKKNLSKEERALIYESLDTKLEDLILEKLSDKQISDAKKIYQSAVQESDTEINEWLATSPDTVVPTLRYVRFLLLKRGLRRAMQNLDKTIQAEYKRNLAMTYHDPLWNLR